MFSVYVTHQQSSPAGQVSFDRLCKRVINPPARTNKTQLPALHPSCAPGKTRETVLKKNAMTALVADIDEPTQLRFLLDKLQRVLVKKQSVIYSTFSSAEDSMRWRVIVPLARPLQTEHWKHFEQALISHLGGDLCTARPTQVFYAPAIPQNGSYQYHIQPGELLEPSDAEVPLVLMAAEKLEQAQQQAGVNHRKKEVHTNASCSIEEFNAANPIADLLHQFGYKGQGRKLLSPYSESGAPGVHILDDHCHVIVYHNSDPLGDGRPHDSFDVIRLLKHKGDFCSAMREIRSGYNGL